MLEFPLNQLQTYYGYLCDLCPLTAFIFSDLNYKMAIFLSQTENAPKHFFSKETLIVDNCVQQWMENQKFSLKMWNIHEHRHRNNGPLGSWELQNINFIVKQLHDFSCGHRN
jgi:hypothetical protein